MRILAGERLPTARQRLHAEDREPVQSVPESTTFELTPSVKFVFNLQVVVIVQTSPVFVIS